MNIIIITKTSKCNILYWNDWSYKMGFLYFCYFSFLFIFTNQPNSVNCFAEFWKEWLVLSSAMNRSWNASSPDSRSQLRYQLGVSDSSPPIQNPNSDLKLNRFHTTWLRVPVLFLHFPLSTSCRSNLSPVVNFFAC